MWIFLAKIHAEIATLVYTIWENALFAPKFGLIWFILFGMLHEITTAPGFLGPRDLFSRI